MLARLRHRLERGSPPREALVARHVRGKSFVDVGCMWSVDGAIAFAARDAGATAVTGVDVMPASERFEARRATGEPTVRYVQGDLHDPAVLAEVGEHDVVWCSGVLYHAPHPLLTLERLASITRERLILATEILPEPLWPLPAPRSARNRCTFAPAPGVHPTHTEAFDPARGYVNWYWGITPSALRAMLAAVGLRVEEESILTYHATVVAVRA